MERPAYPRANGSYASALREIAMRKIFSAIKKVFSTIIHFQFSKLIIVFETALVGYTSYKILQYTEAAINSDYTGSLPYLTTFLGVLFGAYGVSVSFYYSKAKGENLAKIANDHEIRKIELGADVDCDVIDEESI